MFAKLFDKIFRRKKIPCSTEKCSCCYFTKMLKRKLDENGFFSYNESIKCWEIEWFSNNKISVIALPDE